MSVKLYVGNLSFTTTTQVLTDLFRNVGTVTSCNIIEDRDTGRSRGFGFVEMSSRAESENAVAQLDGRAIDGRALRVSEALTRQSRDSAGHDRQSFDSDYGDGKHGFGSRRW